MTAARPKKTTPSSRHSLFTRYLPVLILAVGTMLLFWHVLSRSGYFFGDFANYEYVKLLFHTGQIAELEAPTWCS